jgi:hypothetical protein
VPVLDPEISSGNPVEQKHSQLSRRRPTSAMDHDLKPNKEEDLALKARVTYFLMRPVSSLARTN